MLSPIAALPSQTALLACSVWSGQMILDDACIELAFLETDRVYTYAVV
jgi:hypothetical protein